MWKLSIFELFYKVLNACPIRLKEVVWHQVKNTSALENIIPQLRYESLAHKSKDDDLESEEYEENDHAWLAVLLNEQERVILHDLEGPRDNLVEVELLRREEVLQGRRVERIFTQLSWRTFCHRRVQ